MYIFNSFFCQYSYFLHSFFCQYSYFLNSFFCQNKYFANIRTFLIHFSANIHTFYIHFFANIRTFIFKFSPIFVLIISQNFANFANFCQDLINKKRKKIANFCKYSPRFHELDYFRQFLQIYANIYQDLINLILFSQISANNIANFCKYLPRFN